MSDYALKISVRNGRILRRMRERKVWTIKQLAAISGIAYPTAHRIVTMKTPVYSTQRGDYTQSAQSIAAALRSDPDDLFSEAQRTMVLATNTAETFIDEPTMALLSTPSAERQVWLQRELDHLMGLLTDRERRVIEGRLDGGTLREIASAEGMAPSRVQQLEKRATRKMREAAYRIARDPKKNAIN